MSHAVPHILLADDDPGARLLHATALETGGFSVEVVADGAEAVAAFERSQPDCLVLDVVMPKLTGFDVCRVIRARSDGQRVPILILTSRDELDAINSAYDAGATDFATKGINPLLLVERVRFMLRAKQLQDELITSEARLAQAQAVARIGHWEFDSNGRTVSISDVALEILGLKRVDARSVKSFRHFVHPDDLRRVEEHYLSTRTDRTPISMEFRVATRDGAERIVRVEGESRHHEPGFEHYPRVVAIQDITRLRRAENHARLLAHFDSLTGLPNRAFLQEQLALQLKDDAERPTQTLLVTIDIEQFNRFNHSHGSSAGDELLTRLGDRLRDSVALDNPRMQWNARQAPIIVARTGGDEFGVAITLNREAGHVPSVLQYLSEVLRQPFVVAGKEIVVSTTLGAAVYPDDARDAESLLRQAEAALHQAKQGARGSYQFYSANMQEHAARRMNLQSELRRAIAREQFELHFQPRVDARTLEPVGVEALLRWRHPEHGLVSPNEFIPVAESFGTIVELGEWVLFKACEHAAAFAKAKTPLRVAVNVSAVQLQRSALAEQVAEALRAHSLDPELLEIEVTEGILIDRPELARHTLEALKRQRIRIALDDFGTGYSSLSYLRNLPIDYLKIDRAFVADSTHNDSAAIIATILTLARGLHLKTIAEGIETERQRQMLTRAGCDELQGYLFAHAMSAADLATWLRMHSDSQPSAQRRKQNTGR
jgi:diguanylate cyclase (GGDEF)-like protein/PAS domain S-box-containing protein